MTRTLKITPASQIPPEPRRRDWGPWHLDAFIYVLWTDAGGYHYEIDLEECTTSARVLDWICQVAGKEWDGREHILAGLVAAFDDILRPQAHLCSSGQSKRLTKAAIRQLVDDAAEREGARITLGP